MPTAKAILRLDNEGEDIASDDGVSTANLRVIKACEFKWSADISDNLIFLWVGVAVKDNGCSCGSRCFKMERLLRVDAAKFACSITRDGVLMIGSSLTALLQSKRSGEKAVNAMRGLEVVMLNTCETSST